MEGTWKPHEGLQGRVWREYDSDRDDKNDRSLHSPRHPHRETISTMGKQDRGSSPCERAVFPAGIQKKMKSREVAVSIVLCTCVHTGVCVRTCVHIHVHMCTLDLEQHHRECGKRILNK